MGYRQRFAIDSRLLNELVGHYVNYRKQASPSMHELLPEADFRLFAVSVRFPQALARQTTLAPVRPGVYEVRHFTGSLRLIVVHELPQHENNALLHLFSARADLLKYGAEHYQQRSSETSTLLLQLFERYRLEVGVMPDAIIPFPVKTLKEVVQELPAEWRLLGMTPEDVRKQMPVGQFLKGVSPDELLAALSPEERAALVRRINPDGSLREPERGET
jgi:hypothetical protein